jgi:S1-C subfamily serine protease
LKPILSDLMTLGRVDRPPRPWLGMYTSAADDTVFVAGVAGGGPAERAGIKPGDFVLEVAGARVNDLADTFRRIWAIGPAGSAIPLTIVRDGALQRVTIQSADRNDFLKKPRLH